MKFIFSIDKQTKNRNETGLNLSLGTRLAVLSKRDGLKCCCDAIRTAAWKCAVSLSSPRIVKKSGVFFQRSRVLVGSQGLKRTKWKINTPNVDACAVINPLPKVKFSRLERLYQTPKKWKLAFQKYKLSNSFFKMQLQNCVSKLQSSNSIF